MKATTISMYHAFSIYLGVDRPKKCCEHFPPRTPWLMDYES